MKNNNVQQWLNKVSCIWGVVLVSFFLLSGGAQAEKWVSGKNSVVHKGIRYVVDIDTLEFYDALTDKKINEIKLYDRNEDYKKNPEKYVLEIVTEDVSVRLAGEKEWEQEIESGPEETREELPPEKRWERIGYLRVRGNQLIAVSNLGNRYTVDLHSNTVVKETPDEREEREQQEEEQNDREYAELQELDDQAQKVLEDQEFREDEAQRERNQKDAFEYE